MKGKRPPTVNEIVAKRPGVVEPSTKTVTVVLTEAERKLLVHVLELAGEQFSNHTCNDLNASQLGLTAEEIREAHRVFDPAGNEPYDGPYFVDWILMMAFAKRFREAT